MLPAAASTSSKSLNRISDIIVVGIIPHGRAAPTAYPQLIDFRSRTAGHVAPPLHCVMPRSILANYEREHAKVRRRTGTETLGKASRRPHSHRAPDQGGKSSPAAASGYADIRTRQSAAEERAGPRPGRGHDWPPEVHGASMSDTQARVSVRILEKEYHITCPIEERSDLLDSAEFLNAKMREIRDGGKVVGLDRIAVIAALNMANELIRFRNRDHNLETDVGGRLRILRERVESALEKGQQLEL